MTAGRGLQLGCLDLPQHPQALAACGGEGPTGMTPALLFTATVVQTIPFLPAQPSGRPSVKGVTLTEFIVTLFKSLTNLPLKKNYI